MVGRTLLVKVVKGMAGAFGVELTARPRRARTVDYEKLFGREAVAEKRFYNIGAGNWRHPLWRNLDHDSDWYAGSRAETLKHGNLNHDLLSLAPLPLPSDSACLFFTSHTIEHVTDEADRRLFREVCRVLRPGGVFRVATNDTDLAWRAWKGGDRGYFYWAEQYRTPREYRAINLKAPMAGASLEQLFLFDFASQVTQLVDDGPPVRLDDEEVRRIFRERPYEEALDHCTSLCRLDVQKKYPGFHINWFNGDKIERFLREAGFGQVYRSGWAQSACPVLRDTTYFDATHPRISVYVEAVK
jgi:SAM-dependent methyltransferase